MQRKVWGVIIRDEHGGGIAGVLITEALIRHVKCCDHILLGEPNRYVHKKGVDHHNTTRVFIFFSRIL